MDVKIHDHTTVAHVGGEVRIGNAFAFLSADAFKKPGYEWVDKLRSTPGAPEVVSLVGRSAVQLPGASIGPASLGHAALSVVCSDKTLYREGHDAVHLVVIDPGGAGADVLVSIACQGRTVRQLPVRLSRQGAAMVTITDLPCGDYEATLAAGDPPCAFTVAEYRLAPLVASLVERTLSGEDLSVKLNLTTFGVAVEGDVGLELTDRGQRLQQVTKPAVGGLVEATFKLTGDGPHAIGVHLVTDAARTASVPLVGSRAAERSLTSFSKLGKAISGSLLPSADSFEVRGLFLQEGGTSNSVFKLERVDTRRARLTVMAPVAVALMVVLDASAPSGPPTTCPHPGAPQGPGETVHMYQRAETLFSEGRHAEARAVFLEGRPWRERAHPYWAYYVACCHAREGHREDAVTWLRLALRDGYDEFDHLASDSDLESLRGYEPYEALCRDGRTETRRSGLRPGDVLEIDLPGTSAILCIGAWVDGRPWEGWAATVAPVSLHPTITVPDKVAPDTDIDIAIDTHQPASVYLVVKDARLLSADTPQSRLAGQIKRFVDSLNERLVPGQISSLASLAANRVPVSPPSAWPAPGAGGAWPAPPPVAAAWAAGPPPAPEFDAFAIPAPLAAAPFDAPLSMAPESRGFGAPAARAVPPAARPSLPQRPGLLRKAADAVKKTLGVESISVSLSAPTGRMSFDAATTMTPLDAPEAEPLAPPMRTAVEEPEVVFAGLLEAEDGKATTRVHLGPAFAEYLVEAFVVSNGDWAAAEARFTAARDTYVSLLVPPYVADGDVALGRVMAGTQTDGMRVEVTRDGEPVKLLDGQRAEMAVETSASHIELTFVARPGLYRAVVVAGSEQDSAEKTIERPGKLRRYAMPMTLLQPGHSLSRVGHPEIHGLKILPGVDKPFRALVHSTARYDHLCCEQTAARLMASAVEYIQAKNDADRATAEASVLAGIQREASMHLPGRGIKFYPDGPNEPNSYYGKKAAQHLRYLALLRDVPTLSNALRQGLEIMARVADDAGRAYGLEWPVRAPKTCGEAYMAIRFGDGARDQATEIARACVARDGVEGRAESAYAAATLLRLGLDRPKALELANSVYKHLGPEGSLHSTVDSVAAIALTAELQALGVVGPGKAQVNGRTVPTLEAANLTDEVSEVSAVEGVVAVEVLRVVEEDWTQFQTAVPMLVTLEKSGRPTSRCVVGDALELHVQLEAGYQAGDLVWVCLPDALARVVGGGQVKRFSVDFAGQNEVRIPLAATEATPSGSQHYAVCVRNMFDETRGGNPGLLDVTVSGKTRDALQLILP